jgi:serine protease Do
MKNLNPKTELVSCYCPHQRGADNYLTKPVSRLSRIALSVASAFAASIGILTIHESAWTNPNWVNSNYAVAQSVAESVAAKVLPSVVLIQTDEALGTGFIISPDGLVLTNAHVVSDFATVTVTLQDKTKLQADVISIGKVGGKRDLALLRIHDQKNLVTIPPADLNKIHVGQPVFAIGYPFGIGKTLTTGIISRIDSESGEIQTDAAINHGNSGGPLLNSQGEYIGINTKGPSENVNLAISTNEIQAFLREPLTGPKQIVCRGNQQPQRLIMDSSVVKGRLGEGSNSLNIDKSFCTVYTLTGKTGQPFRIDMVSLDVNPALFLLKPNGTKLAFDYGGENDYARIYGRLPVDGEYQIIVNTRNPKESGEYSLRMQSFILLEQGTLDSGSPKLHGDGSPYESFQFQGQAGQPVRINVESRGFQPYLFLTGPDGQLVAKGNEQLVGKLPSTGLYVVTVNTFDPNELGSFTLMVR